MKNVVNENIIDLFLNTSIRYTYVRMDVCMYVEHKTKEAAVIFWLSK